MTFDRQHTRRAMERRERHRHRQVAGVAVAGGLLVVVGEHGEAVQVGEVGGDPVGRPVCRLLVAAGEVPGAVGRRDVQVIRAQRVHRFGEEGVGRAAGAGDDDLGGGRLGQVRRQRAGGGSSEADRAQRGQLGHQRVQGRGVGAGWQALPVEHQAQPLRRRGGAADLVGGAALGAVHQP
ncbi:hypothetical protein ACPCHT_17405 [Nucisporomicrobium flavum]|uniref:hypothetical protein n=1 Tax=Nucisporomicrobium flavum TaxID=2785915 RepID=UPI003C2FA43A